MEFSTSYFQLWCTRKKINKSPKSKYNQIFWLQFTANCNMHHNAADATATTATNTSTRHLLS